MSAVLRFPGGAAVIPERSRAELLASALDWLAMTEEVAVDLRMLAPLSFSPAAIEHQVALLESRLDHARRAIREAGK